MTDGYQQMLQKFSVMLSMLDSRFAVPSSACKRA